MKETLLMFKFCPSCGNSINPPLASINRQVCYQCGWSSEPEEIQKKSWKLKLTHLKIPNSIKSQKILAISSALSLGFLMLAMFKGGDPYLCSRGDADKAIKKIDQIIDEWDDANAIASSSPRIALAMPVARLQEIQQKVKEYKFPRCTENVIQHFDEMMEEKLKGYLLFMQRADSYEIEKQMSTTRGAEIVFIEYYYSRLKNGESTDVLKVGEASLKDTQDLLKRFEQSKEYEDSE